MFGDLQDLYQEVVLEHGKNPRNRRHPEHFDHEAIGRNPVCGDALVVYLTVDETGRVADCAFVGEGCAISVASASMMTEIVRGKTIEEVQRLFKAFHAMATGEGEPDTAGLDEDDVEHLETLSGVRQFPVRVKCATLPWHTLAAAMGGQASVSTE